MSVTQTQVISDRIKSSKVALQWVLVVHEEAAASYCKYANVKNAIEATDNTVPFSVVQCWGQR